MLRKLIYSVFIIQILVTPARADMGKLLESHLNDDPYTAVQEAYELNLLKMANSAAYTSVIEWLDTSLMQLKRVEYLLESTDLEGYIGFIYYVAEHSQSSELKHKYLEGIQRRGISPLASQRAFSHVNLLAEHGERGFWSRLNDSYAAIKQRRQDLKTARDRLLTTLALYGDYFPLNEYYPKNLRAPLSLCSRILQNTASIAEKLASDFPLFERR
jgi:hypothetical protein